jgi:hypothetical protein
MALEGTMTISSPAKKPARKRERIARETIIMADS